MTKLKKAIRFIADTCFICEDWIVGGLVIGWGWILLILAVTFGIIFVIGKLTS